MWAQRKAAGQLVVIGALLLLSNLWTCIFPNLLVMLVAFATLIGMLIGLVISARYGYFIWRKSSRWWFVPFLTCASTLALQWFAVSPLGNTIADSWFLGHLQPFEQTVAAIRNGSTPAEGESAIVEAAKPPLVRAIKVVRPRNGVLLIAFLANTPVPLLHEGYFHLDCGAPVCDGGEAGAKFNLPYIRRVDGNWFHFSDQPGL